MTKKNWDRLFWVIVIIEILIIASCGAWLTNDLYKVMEGVHAHG